MRGPQLLLPISLVLNVVLLVVLVAMVAKRRTTRPEIGLGAAGWFHQPAQQAFAQIPSGPGCVAFVGDSLTAEGPWGELVGRVLNRGVQGDTVGLVRARLGEVLERRPAAMFLMVGINDLLDGAEPSRVVSGVEDILADAKERSPATRVVVVSILPVVESAFEPPAVAPPPDVPTRRVKNETIRTVNRALGEVVARSGATYVDLHPRFCDANGALRAELTYDGVHLTPAGYVVWRDAIADLVPAAGGVGPPPRDGR